VTSQKDLTHYKFCISKPNLGFVTYQALKTTKFPAKAIIDYHSSISIKNIQICNRSGIF